MHFIHFIQGGCTEMMILRSVIQYDSDNSFWKIPSMNTTNLKADILKLCPKGNVYDEHENFIKTFDIRLRTDERIVLILCAITLFSPDRANVIHQDVIKLEQVSPIEQLINFRGFTEIFSYHSIEFLLLFITTLS